MTETSNDSLATRRWPKWKQIALFAVIFVAGMGALEYYRSTLKISPQAQSIKAYLKPIAAQLEKAQELGDYAAAVALLEPASKVMKDFDELDESQKSAINSTPLRYCMLASRHLLSGAIAVSDRQRWTDRPAYDAALKACK